MKSILCFLFNLLLINSLFAQGLPEIGDLYRDDVVGRVDIEIADADINTILAEGNEYSNEEYPATFIFNNGYLSDTIENVGFRLRGNTSRQSAKKSFKISFNTFESGRKYQGVEKLNLNGEHNDPSIFRAKLGWKVHEQLGLIGSRAAHTELYINGEYKGLYLNVEHIDEEFVQRYFGNDAGNLYKCIYPVTFEYISDNPDSYKFEMWGRRIYQLKTNKEADDYSTLAHFIDVLNNTSEAEMACELEQVFDVDGYLKYMAVEILLGHWDGPLYNKNNCYIYYNPAIGKMQYLPYDLDNTVGIDWFNKTWEERNVYDWGKHSEARPLYWNLIEVPTFRERFTYYMNEILTTVYNPDNLNPQLDSMRTKLAPYAENDTYRTLDYGFSFADFNDSFDEDINFNHVSENIQDFIVERYESALAQLETINAAPVLNQMSASYHADNELISFGVFAMDDTSIGEVEVCYSINNQAIVCEEMTDSDGDGYYELAISLLENAVVDYYFEALDSEAKSTRLPFCENETIYAGALAIPLFINEIMPDNENVLADESGVFEDWLELYNAGEEAIYLGDKYLSDAADFPNQWQMPDVWIDAGAFMLFWADDDPSEGEYHTNFKLNADAESLGIYVSENEYYAPIDEIAWEAISPNKAWGKLPNGEGELLKVSPTPGYSNEPAALHEVNNTIGLSLFPNPFSDKLQYAIAQPNTQAYQLQISNAQGKLLIQIQLENLSNLDLNKLPSGIYLIKVFNEKETILLDKYAKI